MPKKCTTMIASALFLTAVLPRTGACWVNALRGSGPGGTSSGVTSVAVDVAGDIYATSPESVVEAVAEEETASAASALDLELPPVAATGPSDLEAFASAHAEAGAPEDSLAIETFFLSEEADESAHPEAEVETSWFSAPEEPSVVDTAATKGCLPAAPRPRLPGRCPPR